MMQKYQDSSLSPEERASDLLARMNLDEKFGQIQCYNAIDSFLGKSVEKQNPYGVGQVCILIATMLDDVGSVAGLITRLQKQIMESGKHHIPAIFHIETLTGVMVTAATSFPCGLGQASTWDPEQQQKMAACIARQGRAMGISHALAPVFDICRDPRFGRMGETYGEDPTLAAAMGTAYVKGLQDKHRMSACSKHFLGFMAGQGGIHTAQAVVSPRELREVYAKPFQAAIKERYSSVDTEKDKQQPCPSRQIGGNHAPQQYPNHEDGSQQPQYFDAGAVCGFLRQPGGRAVL